eukprot:1594219-Rhodomonas_salina.1
MKEHVAETSFWAAGARQVRSVREKHLWSSERTGVNTSEFPCAEYPRVGNSRAQLCTVGTRVHQCMASYPSSNFYPGRNSYQLIVTSPRKAQGASYPG